MNTPSQLGAVEPAAPAPALSAPLERTALVARLLDFVDQPGGTDADFDRLALDLFAYQWRHNAAYRSLCQRRGVGVRQVKRWTDIPAVPIDAFKLMDLRCEPRSPDERVFMTSGTTRGDQRGRNAHPTLALYDRSMTRNFARRFMAGRERLPMGILFPDEAALPNSSLAHYLALARSEFGSADSRYFLGPGGLDLDGLCARLDAHERSGEPFALLGASYSFVHLFEALQARGLRFALPAGSRILDTGGYKGQSEALPLDAFYERMHEALGVARADCINMYGMTELSTQFYDDGNARVPSVKSGPHWIRSRLVDPLSGREVARGERGILVHCDLCNFNSVSTLLTEDVGQQVEGGFLLLGRAQGAQAKGCSLAVEEFVRANAA